MAMRDGVKVAGLGRCCSGAGGFRLSAMTNKVSKSKSAVRAAREAVKAAQRDVLERARRNGDDLAVFFSSQERLAGVDEWVETKIAGVRAQAEGKRADHRRAAGTALAALRDRGETIRDIAALTGIGEKAVRELIRYAEATPADSADRAYGAAQAHEAAADESIAVGSTGAVALGARRTAPCRPPVNVSTR